MTTYIDELVQQLQQKTQFQVLPYPLMNEDYEKFIKYGIRRLYVDTDRSSVWEPSSVFSQDQNLGQYVAQQLWIDEIEYILIVAQIDFYRRVQGDFNTMVSYTTDAISVTKADEPYKHLQQTIEDLERQRRQLYYRMYRYNQLG